MSKNTDNAYTITVKSEANYHNAPRSFYTIQTGRFLKIHNAQKQFYFLLNNLNEKDTDNLRIEKIGTFHLVRFGKFEDYTTAKQFLRRNKSQMSTAVIVKAKTKDERITGIIKINSL